MSYGDEVGAGQVYAEHPSGALADGMRESRRRRRTRTQAFGKVARRSAGPVQRMVVRVFMMCLSVVFQR